MSEQSAELAEASVEEWGVRVTATGEVEVGDLPWSLDEAQAYIAEGLEEGGENGEGLKPGDETLVCRRRITTPWSAPTFPPESRTQDVTP